MNETVKTTVAPVANDSGDVFRIPLSKMSAKAWPGRVDTKGIVSGVLISLAMICIQQFGERLDTIFFGGLFPVSGRIISFTMIGFGTMMYGVVPGLIVSEINPFISTATGSSPIAPFWLFTNALQMLAAWVAGRFFKNIVSLKYCFAYSTLATVFLTLAYIPLHIFYFRLPWEKLIPMYSFQGVMTIFIPPFLIFGLLKAVKSAGFIEE